MFQYPLKICNVIKWNSLNKLLNIILLFMLNYEIVHKKHSFTEIKSLSLQNINNNININIKKK